MTVGDRIRKRREELDMSMAELARRLHKNRSTVLRYESSEIMNMPADVLIDIANALDTTPADLMGWSTEAQEMQKELPGLSPEELSQITEVFAPLTPDNRAKLLELARLYLNAQRPSEETQ